MSTPYRTVHTARDSAPLRRRAARASLALVLTLGCEGQRFESADNSAQTAAPASEPTSPAPTGEDQTGAVSLTSAASGRDANAAVSEPAGRSDSGATKSSGSASTGSHDAGLSEPSPDASSLATVEHTSDFGPEEQVSTDLPAGELSSEPTASQPVEASASEPPGAASGNSDAQSETSSTAPDIEVSLDARDAGRARDASVDSAAAVTSGDAFAPDANENDSPSATSDATDTATSDSPPSSSLDETTWGAASSTESTSSSTTSTSPPLETWVCTRTGILTGLVRDFEESYPDMEPCGDERVDCSIEKGLAQTELDSDGKPVLTNSARRTKTTVTSAATFAQWFRDVEGVNTPIPFDLRLTLRPLRSVFDSDSPPDGSPEGFYTDPVGFFPIDNLNTSDHKHNYHFTYEVQSLVQYAGGEQFQVRGDDDIWVFINRKLVVDLGGIHLPETVTVDLDAVAEEIGLEPGGVYEFHLFFAERHLEQSNLRLSTTLKFVECTEGTSQ